MWRGARKTADGSSGSAGPPVLRPVERGGDGEEGSVHGRALEGGNARVKTVRLRLVTMVIVQMNVFTKNEFNWQK